MSAAIVVPELGESVLEATIARWLKAEGDAVSVGDILVELETDKVNVEVGAQQAGVLGAILKKEGEDVRVGEEIGRIDEGQGRVPEAAAPQPATEPAAAAAAVPQAAVPPPVPAEEVAAARGEIAGEDRYARLKPLSPIEPAAPPVAPGEAPATSPPPVAPALPVDLGAAVAAQIGLRPEERVRLSRRRRTIAARLVEAQHTAAMLTTFNEVDMRAVLEIRKAHKDDFKERHGASLGLVSFFVKAAVAALKRIPQLNSEIRGDELVLKKYYDIGVAVGAAEGLIVPVLRNADRMTFADIERSIRELSRRSAEGTISLEDLRGGTFTITNGGVFGSLLSTPILNPPEVGILGLHKIEERPVAIGGEVLVRPMMYVALTYDHRVVDGREAVQFLVRIKELVEDPGALLLDS